MSLLMIHLVFLLWFFFFKTAPLSDDTDLVSLILSTTCPTPSSLVLVTMTLHPSRSLLTLLASATCSTPNYLVRPSNIFLHCLPLLGFLPIIPFLFSSQDLNKVVWPLIVQLMRYHVVSLLLLILTHVKYLSPIRFVAFSSKFTYSLPLLCIVNSKPS